jgi:hypothetical protein
MTAEPRRDSQSLRLIEVAAVYSTEELEAWAARIVREEIADAEFDADGNARFQSQDTRPAPGITASIWTVDGHRVETGSQRNGDSAASGDAPRAIPYGDALPERWKSAMPPWVAFLCDEGSSTSKGPV